LLASKGKGENGDKAMIRIYAGKNSKGFRIRPGYVQIIGYECYIRGICNEIDKSWWSGMGGFASRCFIRVKAKHHIKRLKKIFPEITDERIAEGLAIELPTFWQGPTSEYGWSPETSKRWRDLVGSLHEGWRETLGLGNGLITYEEARTAFRKRIKKVHPDMGGTNGETQQLLEAWKFAKVYFGKV